MKKGIEYCYTLINEDNFISLVNLSLCQRSTVHVCSSGVKTNTVQTGECIRSGKVTSVNKSLL